LGTVITTEVRRPTADTEGYAGIERMKSALGLTQTAP
jgi:hypothetical protein